ncbi:MAG TPA: lactate utilization protein [Nitrospirota bacterium]|nr:lactate utilization protein [Nitrospirota bacterium]
MFNVFKAKAEGVSSEVHCFNTKVEAMNFIVQILKKENVRNAPRQYAVWADCPFLHGFDKNVIAENVPGLKFEVTRKLAADAKVGISQADWGLANTGTLVQDSTAVEQRLVSILPEIHIAVLTRGRLLPDLPALFPKLDPRKAAYIAFITGPSRTADIERVLTIGVHGPGRLIIVCVDEQ